VQLLSEPHRGTDPADNEPPRSFAGLLPPDRFLRPVPSVAVQVEVLMEEGMGQQQAPKADRTASTKPTA